MAKKKAKIEDTFRMAINGHELTGVKKKGVWTFTCPSWPDIASKYNGTADVAAITEAFCDRALAPVGDVVRAMRATFAAIQSS